MQLSRSASTRTAARVRTVCGLIVLAALSACQAVPQASEISAAGAKVLAPDTAEWRGHKFAVNRCSDCHSVGYGETSPLPDAPSFAAIANTPELSKTTLNKWMRSHGNYPREMYFEIPPEHIDDLVAYMITLRRPS